ncbi:DUF6232 family protein [Erythrobacter sp. THAF29]|uniref:DUF6232 family protein n=1 Tax=Erythrobacter sp. THAF29 TaxID=2587851 RepID=UPI0012689797|nr:DUF6232 family protein [Erythrobacter sp. THAF29]QFT76043.1 hypothetical protein FIU90_00675 [Erythrobacter sp. THAF29]
MASFHISEGPETLDLEQNDGVLSGLARFSVTNSTDSHRVGILTVRSDAAASWFDIEGGSDRSFQPGETRVVKVRVGLQAGEANGEHAFQLRVAREGERDDDWIDSAPVRFLAGNDLAPAPAPPPEEVLYEDAERRIDWRFARFGELMIGIDRIDGINQRTVQTRRKRAIVLGIVTLLVTLIILSDFDDDRIVWLLLPAVLAFAAWTLWKRKAHLLTAAVGGNEIRLLKTKEETLARRIRAALERAIAGQG